MTASGIDKKLSFRHLFILRNGEFPSGRVTNELKVRFLADGGMCVAMNEDDLRSKRIPPFRLVIGSKVESKAGLKCYRQIC